MYDLLLLKYADVKKREDTCYAIAKRQEVNITDQVLVSGNNRPLNVILLCRDVSMAVIEMIEQKNRIHKVRCVYQICIREIPIEEGDCQ